MSGKEKDQLGAILRELNSAVRAYTEIPESDKYVGSVLLSNVISDIEEALHDLSKIDPGVAETQKKDIKDIIDKLNINLN